MTRSQIVSRAFLIWIFVGEQIKDVTVSSVSSDSSYYVLQRPPYPRDCQEVLLSCPFTNNASGVYTIKPDGYPEPFEVYCDNDLEVGGWTILQRRSTGSINFDRTWEEFRNGFGFLGSEMWLGNDKIAFMTNQKQYELRLEIQNAAGQSYYISYDNFRISDEWGKYALTTLWSFEGTAEQHIDWCPKNKIYSNVTCERMCADPNRCIPSSSHIGEEKCVCASGYKIHDGNCVPNDQCGCYDTDKGDVLQNGEWHVNSNCTRRSNCSNNQLVTENYRCSDDAICHERNGIRSCYCNDGYEGDGVVCTRVVVAKDCQELYIDGVNSDGVYTIYPDGFPSGVQVYCEMESNGGGWTMLQRRSSASVDFYRVWSEYKEGFGNPNYDYWLGNKYIHAITNQKVYQLRIDLSDARSSDYYAIYSSFNISDEDDKYRLSIGSFIGNAGANALYGSNNKKFSTRDQDNDDWSSYHCAERHLAGWWFYDQWHCRRYRSASSCRSQCPSGENDCDTFPDGTDNCVHCANANPNGDYDGSTRGTNIYWDGLSGYDCGINYIDMKIRTI